MTRIDYQTILKNKPWQVMGVAGFLMIFLAWNVLGTSVWFLFLLVLWIAFLYLGYTNKMKYLVPIKNSWTIFFIIFGFSLVVTLSANNQSSPKNGSDAAAAVSDTNSNSDMEYSEYYSGNFSATANFVDKDTQTKTGTYSVSAQFVLNHPGIVKKATIKNISLKQKMLGKTVNILYPGGGFNEPFINNKNELIYEAAQEDSPTGFNTLGKHHGYFSFKIESSNAFEFNTNYAFSISDAGIGPSGTFKYAKINPNLLANTLTFDVLIELESGETVTKHATGVISGQEFHDAGFIASTPLSIK